MTLKPCPFCGSIDVEYSAPVTPRNYVAVVQCNGCGIRVSCNSLSVTDAWNRRLKNEYQ